MRRVVEFLIRYKEYATACALTILSLLLISGSNNSRIGSFRTISVGIIASVQSAFSWIPNPFALETENHALRELNKELSLQNMELREAGIKVERLRAMLEFKERSQMKLLAAEVVGKSTIKSRNYATLNVGHEDGVKEGMPVMTDRGLVGRVVGLNDHFAIVQLLIHRDTRVAAKTYTARNDGIIVWDGRDGLILTKVPAVKEQSLGDTVITSSYSSLYPPNIVIGVITDIEEEQGTLFYRLGVKPTVNFGTLEEAFVVLHSPDQERLELERSIISGSTESDGGNGE